MQSGTVEYKVFRQAMSMGCLGLLIWLGGCSTESEGDVSCERYCSESLVTCAAGNAQFNNESECLDACSSFSLGGEDGDKKGDTLQCRLYHLDVARETDAELHCPHTGADGGGVCVDMEASQCERYCGLIDETCGTSAPQYESSETCLMECEANFRQAMEAGGNTVQCRLLVLGDMSGARTLGERCADAGKVGDSTTCVDVSTEEEE